MHAHRRLGGWHGARHDLAGGAQTETGKVIVFHPDGTSVNAEVGARMIEVGPDGALAWDRLSAIGIRTGQNGGPAHRHQPRP